jgi:hypothetical protein
MQPRVATNVFGEVRRLAYKIMGKNKINNESENVKITRDKGVNSTNWLGKDKSNNFDYKDCQMSRCVPDSFHMLGFSIFIIE